MFQKGERIVYDSVGVCEVEDIKLVCAAVNFISLVDVQVNTILFPHKKKKKRSVASETISIEAVSFWKHERDNT